MYHTWDMKKEIKTETSLIMPVTPEFVERRIYIIRGVKVMYDKSLAELYQVSTKRLNEQVKRNINRFPGDFMFQLTKKEIEILNGQIETSGSLRSQIAISKNSKGGRRYLPYVFTELGVAMLSSVLKSERAVQMNIYIMRAFAKLREMMIKDEKVAQKIKELERGQKENTEAILHVATTLAGLMDEGASQRDAIGYWVDTE